MPAADEHHHLGDARRAELLAISSAALAYLMAALVARHVPGVNGPWYWSWSYWPVPPLSWYPAMLVGAMPVVFAAAAGARCDGPRFRPAWRAIALLSLALAVATLKVTSIVCVYPGYSLARIGQIVLNVNSTSYFTDAAIINCPASTGYTFGSASIASAQYRHNWLSVWPWLLRSGFMHLHTVSKPPGPVAYHMLFVRAMGYTPKAAIASGLTEAALATIAVPATYWLLKVLARDPGVALIGATMLVLCPGFILIYPTLDATYVAPAAIMLATWHLALWRNGPRAIGWAVISGCVAAFLFFMSYSCLVLGVFMLGDAGLSLYRRVSSDAQSPGPRGQPALCAIAAAGTCAAVYAVGYFTLGFDPVRTFLVASENQRLFLRNFTHFTGQPDRPYPWTILFDLTDFLFSAAWITLVPAAAGVWFVLRNRKSMPIRTSGHGTDSGILRGLVLLAVAQILVVAASGLLQAETARVWNFMLPLLLLPAALELGRWRPWHRALFYSSMLLVLLVVGQNLQFLAPVPVFSHSNTASKPHVPPP